MDYAGYVEVGYVHRTHGVKGELQATWDNSLNVNPQDIESVFIEIDGIPVPFFISSSKYRASEKIIIKLDEVDDLHSADELVGHELLILSEQVPDDDNLTLDDLVGYQLMSVQNQVVGTIERYEEFNLNSVFYVISQQGEELIIPAVEELILEVDVDEKIVLMEIPGGLLNLYRKK